MSTPTSEQARNTVNIFTSIDVLGLLSDTEYPEANGKSIESMIQTHYVTKILTLPDSRTNNSLKRNANYLDEFSLQEWDTKSQKYVFDGGWNKAINAVQQHKTFRSTAGTKKLLSKYVRLIANRGDTQGWILPVEKSDLKEYGGSTYLTEAYNLSVKAKPGQWLRWWGHSITPFSNVQCIIANITNKDSPNALTQLEHQQDLVISFLYPSGKSKGESSYNTTTQLAYSRMGQLQSTVTSGSKIAYDIQFNMVSNDGVVFASFQVDPEIIVI